jgi:hypothetical protein
MLVAVSTAVFALAFLGSVPQSPGPVVAGASDTLTLTRINPEGLGVSDPGWARITSTSQWEMLWRNYGQESWDSDGFMVVAQAPTVDFGTHEILAFSYGSTNCGHFPLDIAHIIDTSNERVVVLVREVSPDDGIPRDTCTAMYARIDLILTPRSTKPLRFEVRAGERFSPPPPADWWTPLSVSAALDTGTSPSQRLARRISRRVLPRDTTLSPTEYEFLAANAYFSKDRDIQSKLMGNPRAMRVKGALGWIAADSGIHPRRRIQLMFLERFGLEVASDTAAPLPWLATLLDIMRSGEVIGPNRVGRFPEVALALSGNTTLLDSPIHAATLTWGLSYYPEAVTQACRGYQQRYPPTIVVGRDSNGAVWTTGSNCPSKQ